MAQTPEQDKADAVTEDAADKLPKDDESIDDMDAIDQLLAESGTLDVDQQEIDTQVSAYKDETEKQSAMSEAKPASDDAADEIDEFADEPVADSVSEDEFADEPETDSTQEVDEFAEKPAAGTVGGEDEFADETAVDSAAGDDKFADEPVADSPASIDESADDEAGAAAVASEDLSAPASDDLLGIEDFDISSDEQLQNTAETDELTLETEPLAQYSSDSLPSDVTAQLSDLGDRIKALDHSQNMIQKQIKAMETKVAAEPGWAAEAEALHSEHKKLRKKVSSQEDKKPVTAYVSLGLAITALLAAIGFGVVGIGASMKGNDMNRRLLDLEDRLDVLSAQDPNDVVATVSKRLTQVDMELAGFSSTLDSLEKRITQLESEEGGSELKKQLETIADQQFQIAGNLEALQTKMLDLEDNANRATVKKAVVRKKWAVNLVSFKQEWYARRKAKEFEKQGVPVEVTKTRIKGDDWFRLRVKGFKTKYEAAAYATKVKKMLNLTSVWVTEE